VDGGLKRGDPKYLKCWALDFRLESLRGLEVEGDDDLASTLELKNSHNGIQT
jgi:hypothetical protein